MIRLLTLRDHDTAQSYLDNDPFNNVYLIHGLQTQDFENGQVTLWGAFNEGRLEGILFVNYDGRRRSGYLAGDDPLVLARLGKFALEVGADSLLGKSVYIRPAVAAVEDLYPRVEIQHSTDGHLYEVHPGQAMCHHDYPVRTATRDDIPLLVELYTSDEFSGRRIEQLEREIRGAVENQACFFIVLEGRAVSVARIDPETDQAGVIESARTLPEFRGRGMYLSVRTACVEYLSEKGKVALGVIKDTNTAMHKVVNKCGGSLTDPWLYVRFKKRPPLRRRMIPPRLRRWGSRVRDRVSRQLLRVHS